MAAEVVTAPLQESSQRIAISTTSTEWAVAIKDTKAVNPDPDDPYGSYRNIANSNVLMNGHRLPHLNLAHWIAGASLGTAITVRAFGLFPYESVNLTTGKLPSNIVPLSFPTIPNLTEIVPTPTSRTFKFGTWHPLFNPESRLHIISFSATNVMVDVTPTTPPVRQRQIFVDSTNDEPVYYYTGGAIATLVTLSAASGIAVAASTLMARFSG